MSFDVLCSVVSRPFSTVPIYSVIFIFWYVLRCTWQVYMNRGVTKERKRFAIIATVPQNECIAPSQVKLCIGMECSIVHEDPVFVSTR